MRLHNFVRTMTLVKLHILALLFFCLVVFLFYAGIEIPEIECASPLGMENRTIPDSSIVASSRLDEYRGPERGRLNEKPEGNKQ